MAKILAPNKGYSGPGAGGVVFIDGVAETDDEAALNYFRAAGYTVDGDAVDIDGPDPSDARDVTAVLVGTALRDAAVDPEPSDFLPPIGAGEGDPHGPTVVSPEVHASGPAGIRPGLVHVDDNGKQEARESAYAEARLVDQLSAGDAVVAEVSDLDDRGPLGLSDPGSAEAVDGAAPKQSDSKSSWVDYAVASGADRGEAEAQTKAELIASYGS